MIKSIFQTVLFNKAKSAKRVKFKSTASIELVGEELIHMCFYV